MGESLLSTSPIQPLHFKQFKLTKYSHLVYITPPYNVTTDKSASLQCFQLPAQYVWSDCFFMIAKMGANSVSIDKGQGVGAEVYCQEDCKLLFCYWLVSFVIPG